MALSLMDPVSPQQLWAQHPEIHARLFLLLGGGRRWFYRHVFPWFERWADQLAGLNAEHRPVLMTLLDDAMTTGPREVNRGFLPSPAQELKALDRRLRDLAESTLSDIEVHAPSAIWRYGAEALGAWRLRHPGPLALVLPDRRTRRLAEVIQALIHSGVWFPGPMGRLLPSTYGWALLWPLAGRDLSQRAGLEIDDLRGLLSETKTLGTWAREDGRAFHVLAPKPYFQAVIAGAL